MLEFEFNSDNSQIGFRLQYLEVLNWGTFHHKIWRIEPGGNNALLTGGIGSGKSTLVDALTCLLVPHHKITFNKAASAETKERSLVSYIKGYFKHEKDELSGKEKPVSLRYTSETDCTFSVILANFNNQGFEQNITLAQVFWMKDDKPQKLLLISKKPLNIKTHFTQFSEIPELKRKLKEQQAYLEVFDDNFLQYSQQFRRYFGMNSDKAIDLFYQTVSMKSVSDLTTFVREQMLEKTDVKSQIEELKKRFSDLTKTHDALVRLREQKEILEPLTGFSTQIKETTQRIKHIEVLVELLPAFFASQKFDLLQIEIQEAYLKLNQLNNLLKQIAEELEQKRQASSQIRQDIYQNGGRRLEEIDRLLQEAENRKKIKKEKHNQYISLTTLLNFSISNTDKTFYNNLQKGQHLVPALEEEQAILEKKQFDKKIESRDIDEKINSETEELNSLKRRKTQLPDNMLNLRQQLIADLDIAEAEIPFIGELIKVRDTEKEWEGAIERLLHGFGLSLIVPEKHYARISYYVNSRSLQVKTLSLDKANPKGQRLEYFKVPATLKYKVLQDTATDSVLHKLEIKPNNIYEEWLEQELQKRFNLRCVALEDFQRQQDVLTKEGQFKTGDIRHVKDDRRELWDCRHYVLGWTNFEKIKAVQESLNNHKRIQTEVTQVLTSLKSALDNNKNSQKKLHQFLNIINWQELNWEDEAKTITSLQREQQELKNSNNILQTLQDKLDAILNTIKIQLEQEKELTKTVGSIESEVKLYQTQLEKCLQDREPYFKPEAIPFYASLEALVAEKKLTVKNIDTIANSIRNSFTDKHSEKEKLTESINKAKLSIIKLMKDYNVKFISESADLSPEPESIAEYEGKLNNIIQQDLPRHEKKFKELLNENTIRDITAFDNKLDIHQKSIREKIGNINGHLKDIVYDNSLDTFIELEMIPNPNKYITDFKNDLKACYASILSTEDAYNEERFKKVKTILDRFTSQATTDVEWTNLVTDVRNWSQFNAYERYRADNTPKEFYSGTSGKSGGQKEKLAYTVLASALAYQYGLTYGEPKSKSFRFVVIDEAFGRGDDASTQFGLNLFRKLNLQLLIVTPLQKIHVIENHVNAVHYISNPDGNNSEVQNLQIEEYKEEKIKTQMAALL